MTQSCGHECDAPVILVLSAVSSASGRHCRRSLASFPAPRYLAAEGEAPAYDEENDHCWHRLIDGSSAWELSRTLPMMLEPSRNWVLAFEAAAKADGRFRSSREVRPVGGVDPPNKSAPGDGGRFTVLGGR